MLTEKEKKVYETIKVFLLQKGYSPTIRELCQILNYHSTKTIYKYLISLKEKNFIHYKKRKKRSITIKYLKQNIEVNKINNLLNYDDNYYIYQIKDDYLKKYFIKKNDYLIINPKKKIKNNDLGLFFINNKYQVMHYQYYDGYYILEGLTKEFLYKINLIGVVERIYRDAL